MARRHADPNEHRASSSWQPVQPTSREERARLRQRQFTPIIGASAGSDVDFRTSSRSAQPEAPTPSPSAGQERPWAPSGATAQAEAARATTAASKGARTQALPRKAAKGARPKNATSRGGAPGSSVGTGHAVASVVMGVLAVLVAPSSWFFGLFLAVIALVQAGKAKKLGARAVVGRVLGALGIVTASLALVTSGLSSMDGLFDESPYLPAASSENAASPSSDGSSALSSTASEARVEELARAQFDKLESPDEDTVRRVAAVLDDNMLNWYGLSHADLGLDATESARWALEGSSYSLSSVFAFDDDKEGSAYADVSVRDASVLDEALWNALETVEPATIEELRNDPAGLATVAAAYRDALQSTSAMEDRFVSVEFVAQDGDWALDEDSWDSTLESLYHL